MLAFANGFGPPSVEKIIAFLMHGSVTDEVCSQMHIFIFSGGGSANKSFLFQQTKAVLNETKLLNFLDEKIKVAFLLLSYKAILIRFLCELSSLVISVLRSFNVVQMN